LRRWGSIEALTAIEAGLLRKSAVVGVIVGVVVVIAEAAGRYVDVSVVVGVVHVAGLLVSLLWIAMEGLVLLGRGRILLLLRVLLWELLLLLLGVRLLGVWLLLVLWLLVALWPSGRALTLRSLALNLHGLVILRRRGLRNAVDLRVVLIQLSKLN
jgi:hypothetical protein